MDIRPIQVSLIFMKTLNLNTVLFFMNVHEIYIFNKKRRLHFG